MPELTAVASTPPPAPRNRVPTSKAFDLLDGMHRQIGEHLTQLEALATRLQEHGVDAQAGELAKGLHEFFSTTSAMHHEDEELHVFPALLGSKDEALVHHVKRLQQDHGWIEQDWRELGPQIEALSKGYSWFDVDQLIHGVPLFVALCLDHMALEESLIYPEAKARLSVWDVYGIGREMAERRRRKATT
jgi:hemerythrin-like domain-containing protein